MATLARRTSQTSSSPRRRSAAIAKLKDRLKSASRRARNRGGFSSSSENTVLTATGAMLFAYAEKRGVEIPTVAGIDPALLIGGLIAVAGPRVISGKNGQRLQAIGDGVLAYGAARAVNRGGVKVAGEDDDDDLSVSGVQIEDDD